MYEAEALVRLSVKVSCLCPKEDIRPKGRGRNYTFREVFRSIGQGG